jgi:hypothetical protein
VCRSAAGSCDLAERCDGASASCPPDAKSTALCRSAAGACDVAEICDGAGDACPPDAFAGAGVECRAAAGDCDVVERCTGSSPACPADTGLPDGDGDGTCDARDDCPSDRDPAQSDGDGDGIGDVCDPCTNGAAATRQKITATRLLPPPGDDRLAISGEAIVPTLPAIDPAARGVRVLLNAAGGGTLLDTTIPSGAYDSATGAGWKTTGGGRSWSYRGSGMATAGIQRVTIKTRNVAGMLRFKVKGKGAYAVVQTDLPVTATIVIDVPAAQRGQCAVAAFPLAPPARPSCVLTAQGATLRCK